MIDLYQDILNTTHALIVVLDGEGRIELFNQACERVTGYGMEEVKGKRLWDFLLQPEEAEGVRIAFEELRQGKSPGTHENHWITKSGEHRLIAWSNSAVTDDHGLVVHIIGTGIDITVQRQVEKALGETEQRQRALLDSISDAAWLKNRDGIFIEVNRIAAERCGRDRVDVIGRVSEDILPVEVAAQWTRDEQQVMRLKEALRSEACRTINGEPRWFDSIITPVIGPAGDVIGTAGVSRDITERMLMDAQRRTRDDALRPALIREVNHRIKNNLQGVTTLLQYHADTYPEIAGVVESAITRLRSIAVVHGLSGAGELHEVDLLEMVNALAKSLGDLYSEVSFVPQTGNSFSRVHLLNTESVPLALILNELMLNAIKHGGDTAGEPVRILLERIGPTASVTIASSSASPPAQPFDFAKGIGLGMGLTLVKLLLPAAGAEIRFENASSGGVVATFIISSPLVVEPLEPDRSDRESSSE